MSTVHVKGIANQTTDKEIRDFFSFCGKISDLKVTPDSSSETKSATVTFEKETAAKTALLLDNTQLGPAQIHVTTDASTAKDEDHDDEIAQEDKPRSRIIAEYLAHGYVISDKAIENAIALDQKHGVSQRFMSALLNIDSKYKVTDKSKAVDEKYGLSNRANYAWGGIASYFDKAANTPTGQKLRTFYEQGNKQVMDVHNEARHLANLKSGKTGTPEKDSEGESKVGVEEADVHTIPGTDKTECNCGATAEKCPCPAGKCGCSKCAKNSDAPTASS